MTNNIKISINYSLFLLNLLLTLFSQFCILDSMGTQSESAISKANTLIETGKLVQARALLEEALTADLDNTDLVFAVRCCTFWEPKIENTLQLDAFEYGENLINQWKQFRVLLEHEKNSDEDNVFAFKKLVYTRALEQYKKASDESDLKLKAEIYRKAGLCYKKLGFYEEALKCLTESNNLVQDTSPVLAEMADCYDLCGETKLAKVLFREAFYIDPEKIDLTFLDSPMIKILISRVAEKKYSGALLQEWIPVYGVLYGVFTVKRKLRSQEVGRLKQDIYAKENELKDPENDSTILRPRLLNMYFRLMDHYVLSKDNVSKINEVLLSIKLLDPEVYEMYIK